MKKTNRIIFLLAIVKFILPYLLQSNFYEPHRDEFLYLAEGYHLAWGYLEIPPLLSFFAWLTHLLGDSVFWIKFWPDMFGVFTFVLAAKIVQSLGGKAYAIFLVFLPFIFGGYLRVFFLFQPNAPEFFFWTMMAFSVIMFIQTKKDKWLYVFGISVGLGMLSKYSVLFFTISILLGLLVSKERKIFMNKHLYYAGAISLLIFLPTLLWEFNHHFPVVTHMRELRETQLQYISPTGFLTDQIFMNLPTFFIWLAGLYFIIVSAKAKKYRALAWSYLFVIVILLVFQGKSYYSLGAYPMLFAFGAFHLENFCANRSVIWKYALIIFPVFVGILMIPVLLPVAKPKALANYYHTMNMEKYGFQKWEDLQNHPLPQDFADMLGWEEMAQKAAKAWATLDSNEKKQAILYCDNYGQAGAVNFYRKKYGLPEAYTDNGSFLFWMPKSKTYENIVLVTDDRDEMQRPFIKQFKSAVAFDSITNRYAREYGSLIIILKGPDQDFTNYFHKRIEDKKTNFGAGK
ncbi:MAG: glycosyltransferase family 39 protein [Ginsengibacter sp.]